jgi:CMP-2-keto-3-deoxyoctulosonic acid synthetase
MKENTNLQLIEDIEWLKIMEQGYKIISSCVKDYEIGVNLIEDYNFLKKKYNLI